MTAADEHKHDGYHKAPGMAMPTTLEPMGDGRYMPCTGDATAQRATRRQHLRHAGELAPQLCSDVVCMIRATAEQGASKLAPPASLFAPKAKPKGLPSDASDCGATLCDGLQQEVPPDCPRRPALSCWLLVCCCLLLAKMVQSCCCYLTILDCCQLLCVLLRWSLLPA